MLPQTASVTAILIVLAMARYNNDDKTGKKLGVFTVVRVNIKNDTCILC